jgi:hypothetical protein
MTLAQVKALLVGQTVFYTPVGETYKQTGTVVQNGPDIYPPPPALSPPSFPPAWLRIVIHDPGTGNDWHLDYVVSGDIPTLSLPP